MLNFVIVVIVSVVFGGGGGGGGKRGVKGAGRPVAWPSG